MHADKIGAKKESNYFLINPRVFDLRLLFSLKFTEGHLIADYQMIYPKSKIKIDTKNHRKRNFNLTIGQFLFSKYKTIKGLHILNDVCWVFDQKT
jgi:hypothetical protein